MQNIKNLRVRRRPESYLPSKARVWQELRQALLLLLGTSLSALGFAIFQVPHNLAAGGLTGLGLIVNQFTGSPVGLLYSLLNIPLLIVGYRHLGRWRFVVRTLVAALLFSTMTDLLVIYGPRYITFPVTEDLLLNTVYGGIVGGIGGGLIYRAGSTMGGTGIIGRLIQLRTGQPLSQTYFYTDGAILLGMGLVFGWEVTLYGLLMLFLNGIASDYTLEGPSSIRVATVITNHPRAVSEALIQSLGRGVSYWEVIGGYTGQRHYLVTCTLYRSQLTQVRQIVAEVDPEAFLTIGVGHQASGEGFTPLPRGG